MDDYAIVLRLDMSDTAPEGPGWYLYATGVERTGENQASKLLRRPQRIAGRNAMDLAARMQSILSPSEEMTPGQIVSEGNAKVVQRIKDQIAYAEKQAQRIGNLRRILQTESEQQGE